MNTDSTWESCSFHVLHATRNFSVLGTVLLVNSIEESVAHITFQGERRLTSVLDLAGKRQPCY